MPLQMASCSLVPGLWLLLLLQDIQGAPQVRQGGIRILQPWWTKKDLGEIWGNPGMQGNSAHYLYAGCRHL